MTNGSFPVAGPPPARHIAKQLGVSLNDLLSDPDLVREIGGEDMDRIEAAMLLEAFGEQSNG